MSNDVDFDSGDDDFFSQQKHTTENLDKYIIISEHHHHSSECVEKIVTQKSLDRGTLLITSYIVLEGKFDRFHIRVRKSESSTALCHVYTTTVGD